jgi:CxxC motif-containing protein (DUF1111 family)
MITRLKPMVRRLAGLSTFLFVVSRIGLSQGPAKDPGVRGGPPSAGTSYGGLSTGLIQLYQAGAAKFAKTDTVAGDGLGPRMNLNSCAGCHTQPTMGGSSAKINPQFAFVNGPDRGANRLPSFITQNGPTREARFKKLNKTTLDGGVHDLFTIAGMKGAATCKLAQPDFATELRKNNVIFRVPTPVFGAGLIEQIQDSTIAANVVTQSALAAKSGLGINGKLNIVVSGNTVTGQKSRIMGEANANANDGTIARFGWKAQNKSLLLFTGEAYNVEMGITNELFQTEREEECQLIMTPNDFTDPTQNGLDVLSDIEKFAAFMRLLAPPAPSTTEPGGAASISSGKALFTTVGCSFCHTPSLRTSKFSQIPQLRDQEAQLYSDLAIHQMGPNLDDGVKQGQAEGNEFRTAPLWGLGQRVFFLHDGRTNDLVKAIQEHRGGNGRYASEANAVIKKFDRLSERQKQYLLNFLRSL